MAVAQSSTMFILKILDKLYPFARIPVMFTVYDPNGRVEVQFTLMSAPTY
jgi:hypothetical protein